MPSGPWAEPGMEPRTQSRLRVCESREGWRCASGEVIFEHFSREGRVAQGWRGVTALGFPLCTCQGAVDSCQVTNEVKDCGIWGTGGGRPGTYLVAIYPWRMGSLCPINCLISVSTGKGMG